MKKKSVFINLSVLITLASLLLLVIFCYPVKTNAAMTGDASPSVSVTAGGSITVTPTGMSYGSKAAGTHTAYDADSGHKVALTINTNTTTWDVKVSKNNDLTSGANSIASANFIYTSIRISGTPAAPDVYSDQPFGASGTPSNVTDSPATPAACADLVVDVRYDLTLPSTQTAASNYQATHTYTLTAS